jgi:GAF domain-containing protein
MCVGHDGPIPATPVVPLTRGILAARAVLDRQTIHVTDLQAEGEKYPEGTDFALRHGFRTILAVPLIRGGEAIGVIAIRRNEVRPFTDRQIDLLQTFANQAVIAIDNARLFEAEQARTRELQARSAELTEALKQQTATADVLKVISRSAFDLQKVLDTLVESAARLCQADMAGIVRPQGSKYHNVASFRLSAEFIEYIAAVPLEPGRGTLAGRVLLERKVVQIPYVLADPEYILIEGQRRAGFRTLLGVPLPHAPLFAFGRTRVLEDPVFRYVTVIGALRHLQVEAAAVGVAAWLLYLLHEYMLQAIECASSHCASPVVGTASTHYALIFLLLSLLLFESLYAQTHPYTSGHN